MNYTYSIDFTQTNPGTFLKSWIWYNYKIIGPCLILGIIVNYCFYKNFENRLFLGFAVVLSGMFVITAGFIYMRYRLSKKRVKRMNSKVFTYHIQDDGFGFKSEMAEGSIKWGFKGKVISCLGNLMIISHEYGYFPLPKEIPEDVLEFLRKRLDA